MKPFYELTEVGRARRLRAIAYKALQSYNFQVTGLKLLCNEYNCVFRVDTACGNTYALRICKPQAARERTLSLEASWLYELGSSADFEVPAPIPSQDGSLYSLVADPGVPEERYCILFRWIKGLDLAKRFTMDNLVRYGALAATLHKHGARFKQPKDAQPLVYKDVNPYEDPWVLEDPEHTQTLPTGLQNVIPQAIEHVKHHIQQLQETESMQVIHGDLHAYNVKAYRNKLSPIDFEDLVWGYPVQDLGILFFYMWSNEEYAKQREAIERGYRQVREWPEQLPGQVDAFIVGRALVLLNLVMQQKTPEMLEFLPGLAERTETRLRTLLGC
ncbi:MAG: hypothetical protein EP343_12275 [Deltaproteobacteria bacterium]|nr:MAG: hypothetical protein EP343_12275 [Deltaproteobacteria bacterium]